VRVVRLGLDERGLPDEALVLRDREGQVRAYRNLCKHLPIPIDSGSRRFLAPDGTHLLCRTHGATYRPEDGLCIEGPCQGDSLDAFAVDEEDGVLYVVY
jgi:nitrite reductase/ring-hydroxylating ferredoxin subunit